MWLSKLLLTWNLSLWNIVKQHSLCVTNSDSYRFTEVKYAKYTVKFTFCFSRKWYLLYNIKNSIWFNSLTTIHWIWDHIGFFIPSWYSFGFFVSTVITWARVIPIILKFFEKRSRKSNMKASNYKQSNRFSNFKKPNNFMYKVYFMLSRKEFVVFFI